MKMQPKLIASAITVALLAGAVHAAENAGGGQPTSTPTHTVPVKPTDQLTIKTKSSPPYAPPIEDERKPKPNNPGNGCSPSDPTCKPCPKGWQWVPKLKTCTKPTEIRHDLPKNDSETGSGAGGTLPHPWDPIPPHPRPKPVRGSDPVPVGPHMPRDPGDGSGVGPNPGGNPVEPALPNGPKPIKLDKATVAPHKLPPPREDDCRRYNPPTC
jgi:hypothetical protein